MFFVQNIFIWKSDRCGSAPPKYHYFELQEGVYIYGLYLDGAGWERRGCKLIEPQPKVLFTLLPVVHVYAVNSTAPKDPRLYQCPVYKKPQRTDLTYITPLWLKTVQSPDHWILRGVALLCDIKWKQFALIFEIPSLLICYVHQMILLLTAVYIPFAFTIWLFRKVICQYYLSVKNTFWESISWKI